MGKKSNKSEVGSKSKNKIDNNSTREYNPILKGLDKLTNIKCLNAKQKELCKTISEKDVVICIGSAGTGKTYNSLAQSLKLLKQNNTYEKLILTKSVTVVEDQELGFLPGEIDEKLAPFMYSYDGNINKILNNSNGAKYLKDTKVIEYLPLAYIRGCQYDNSIVIIDEAQNLNLNTFKTLITRLGSTSKLIILGDVEQIDLKKKSDSCLSKICDVFKDSDYVGVVEFRDEDCVRNPIITDVINRLRKLD